MHVINRFGMTWLRWNLKQLNHTLRYIRVVLQTKWYICWISYWLQSFNSPNWWRILSTDSIFLLWKSNIDGIRKHIFLGTPYVKLDATSARMHVFIICFAGFHTPKTRQLCHLGKGAELFWEFFFFFGIFFFFGWGWFWGCPGSFLGKPRGERQVRAGFSGHLGVVLGLSRLRSGETSGEMQVPSRFGHKKLLQKS